MNVLEKATKEGEPDKHHLDNWLSRNETWCSRSSHLVLPVYNETDIKLSLFFVTLSCLPE